MPVFPIIVPLVLTGILIGYILRTTNVHIGRRLMALGSLLGGVGNVVNAAILFLFQNQTAVATDIRPYARQATLSPVLFLVLSFVVGVLTVLLVLVPATIVQKRKLSFLEFFFRLGGKKKP